MTKFKLETYNRNIPNESLLEDLRAAFELLNTNGEKLTYRSYAEVGKYSSSIFSARFGSWNEALKEAGISINEEKNPSEVELFTNLENVWISKGKQPTWREMENSESVFGPAAYKSKFGSWRKALEAFVLYVNGEENNENENEEPTQKPLKPIRKPKRTSRNISDRMRFRILVRDGFTCQSCGASPLNERGVELHVDHIIPWSKGGETEDENLEVKCSRCNLGKGNAFNK